MQSKHESGGEAEGREMLFNLVGEKHQKTFQNKRRCGSYILAWTTVIRSVIVSGNMLKTDEQIQTPVHMTYVWQSKQTNMVLHNLAIQSVPTGAGCQKGQSGTLGYALKLQSTDRISSRILS